MKVITINEAMVLLKAIRGRLAELSNLRSQSANKETFFGDHNKVIEPQYDLKAVDKKCVELENFIYVVDTKIKQSNAITKIEINADVNILLSPLT